MISEICYHELEQKWFRYIFIKEDICFIHPDTKFVNNHILDVHKHINNLYKSADDDN